MQAVQDRQGIEMVSLSLIPAEGAQEKEALRAKVQGKMVELSARLQAIEEARKSPQGIAPRIVSPLVSVLTSVEDQASHLDHVEKAALKKKVKKEKKDSDDDDDDDDSDISVSKKLNCNEYSATLVSGLSLDLIKILGKSFILGLGLKLIMKFSG